MSQLDLVVIFVTIFPLFWMTFALIITVLWISVNKYSLFTRKIKFLFIKWHFPKWFITIN